MKVIDKYLYLYLNYGLMPSIVGICQRQPFFVNNT